MSQIVQLTTPFHLDAPEGTKLEATSTKVERGDSVTFTCTANSNPPPTSYEFYHKHKLLQASASNTYTIGSVLAADEGNYKCQPINVVGPGQDATIFLKVEGKIHHYFALLLSGNGGWGGGARAKNAVWLR